MMQSLFLASDLEFTKVGAAEVTLPDDPNGWPTEILQELYKQAPYLADFMPDIVMDRVDAEQRFGFGHVEVSNKTEIQQQPGSPMMQAAGVNSARIPIIIREGKLQPFDVIVTSQSKMIPLTERRLREALFRPQIFDVTSRTPGDQSMISQLYPPYRQNYGFGGGGAVMTAGMGKEGEKKEALNLSTIGSYLKKQTDPQGLARASKSLIGRGTQQVVEGGAAAEVGRKKVLGGGIAATRAAAGNTAMPKAASLLEAILPTINQSDFDVFMQIITEPQVKAAYALNKEATLPALKTLAKYEARDLTKRASSLAGAIKPNILQIYKTEEGYVVKTASHKMWAPVERTIDRGQLVELVGVEGALTIDKCGAITMADEASIDSDQPEADRPEPIKDYGIYRVQTEDGKQLIGFCFPNLIDLSGESLPLVLFTNGSVSAVQGEIAGVRVAEGASLMESRPRGHGVFYQVLPNGKAQATIPFTVSANIAGDEPSIMAETMDGRQVNIVVQPNVTRVTQADEGTVIIPDTFRWMPLDQTESVALVEQPEQFSKEAAPHSVGQVTIRAGGSNIFSISGDPVDKIAEDDRNFIDVDQAMFLLAGLGVSPTYATQKLGEAINLFEPIEVPISRFIESAEDVKRAMMAKAASILRKMPNLRQSLVKEAAAVPDPAAVDTVLSLGFVNPENMMTFVSYLPDLDDAQAKLCELLVAARLGIRELQPTSIERAIKGLETTIEGLNVISFNESA